jgi:hypothetical protein
MGFYLVKTASKVYLVDTAGADTELTLPSGVAVLSGRRQRAAVLDRHLVAVNGTSQPLWIDPNGATPVCRSLAIPVPPHAPSLSAGAAGALSGTYNVSVAFLIKNSDGDVIAHGPYSVLSSDVTVAAQKIAVSVVPVSPHPAVNCRRLARSTDGPGAVQFEWIDIDDNTTTTISDDLADEALGTLPIDDDLGVPPYDLELIVEWKRRLWGKSRSSPDAVRFSGDGAFYAWDDNNEITIPPFGNDLTGVNGFIRRRDELGIGRLDRWWKIIGDDIDTFARLVLIEGTGIVAPDSTVTIQDIGYWLAQDGVYRWGPDGVASISKGKVHGWFSKDDTFNRALFSQAVGWWDPRFNTYNLLLCAAGSTVLDRWVVYDIEKQRWFGPHKTGAFTPTFAALLADADVNFMPVLAGSDGYIYKMNQAPATDAGTAIELDIRLRHNCKTPDIEKVFQHLSMLTKIETGGTLTITPALGRVDAANQAPAISHALTTGRERLRRVSTATQEVGRVLTLKFTNAENNQTVHIYGYELPFHEARRG